ncbi:DUF1772 domain-containing protein [Photobacterium sp. 1_MG-2023]|uniref:DUF1772 domain-containing protein n=1 Tax=Photobacterium sp. 1_MG-2023 TaxID=3062646 RepID=UPI0026E386FE|nr:DUF1772 domain-containing protein [Photobacterium sp. 1_MG-2023]MDO6705595.1 DUF1772 domain-containing protein [Photobacterium sp. 1_MG-2023]
MADFAGVLAAFSASLFCGAASYISLVEHPARLECGGELAATEFQPSYRRAARMQVTLALVSTLAAITAAAMGGLWLWLLGGALIFAVIPFTFLAIMPINRQLQATGLKKHSSATFVLLEQWGRLHAIRTAMSLLACLIDFAVLVVD